MVAAWLMAVKEKGEEASVALLGPVCWRERVDWVGCLAGMCIVTFRNQGASPEVDVGYV